MLDGNFALGHGPGTDYPLIHIFICILERTDGIMKVVLETITFVLSSPLYFMHTKSLLLSAQGQTCVNMWVFLKNVLFCYSVIFGVGERGAVRARLLNAYLN